MKSNTSRERSLAYSARKKVDTNLCDVKFQSQSPSFSFLSREQYFLNQFLWWINILGFGRSTKNVNALNRGLMARRNVANSFTTSNEPTTHFGCRVVVSCFTIERFPSINNFRFLIIPVMTITKFYWQFLFVFGPFQAISFFFSFCDAMEIISKCFTSTLGILTRKVKFNTAHKIEWVNISLSPRSFIWILLFQRLFSAD